jgi:hypothetical protein
MSKRILFGGLVAVGLMAVSAGTASAQFVTPFGQPGAFGGSYGAVYQTPSGGIVQKQAYSNPFTGNNYYSKSYANPYTGGANYVQSYANPYTGVFVNRQAYVAPNYFGTNFGFGNAFNTTPYVTTPVFGPYWRSQVYTPLPFYRR